MRVRWVVWHGDSVIWRAALSGCQLTVTLHGDGTWQPEVCESDRLAISRPSCRARGVAMLWAERQAGGNPNERTAE